jgi:hypothetical protein
MIRRLLVLAALGIIVSISAVAAASTGGPPPPRKALLEARGRAHRMAANATSAAIHKLAADAARQLGRATFSMLWINPREIDAPAYGTNVFLHSARAVADLAELEPASSPAIKLILGADRRLAQIVIEQARGAGKHMLAAARHSIKAGESEAAQGRPGRAVRAYREAWQSAFRALTQLIATKVTRVPRHDLIIAAENALGSKKIGLAGPRILSGKHPLTKNGKPELFFAGSEACPFCGVERWGMIVALSQFGRFSNLHLMQSEPFERPADRTFTFYRSRYRSRLISFVPVEVWSNVRRGFKFLPLQPLTKAQNALVNRYDPPAETPFIDVAGRFIKVESTVLPRLIANRSWTQVADSLTHPNTLPAQAIAGTAEVLTAELCRATGGKPTSVCSRTVVHDYQVALPLLDGHGGGCPPAAADVSQAQPELGGAVAARKPAKVREARCHTG